MKILPRINNCVIRLWFPSMEDLNAYWKEHRALRLGKELTVNIKPMTYEEVKGYEFKVT